MNSFDTAVFHAINQFAGHIPIFDQIMQFVANYGLEVYIFLFILAWFVLPKKDERSRHSLITAVFGGILALLLNVILAHFWYRDRPFVTLGQKNMYLLIPHAADASFPSDHTSGSFAFAASSWGTSPKWVSRTFTIFAFVQMFSRVYVGVHWPTDVLASLVIGIGSGRVIQLLSPQFRVLTNIGLRIFKYGKYARSVRN